MNDQNQVRKENLENRLPEKVTPELPVPELSPEKITSLEQTAEQELSRQSETQEPEHERPRKIAQPTQKTSQFEETLPFGTSVQQVEAVLAENLLPVYQAMSPDQQQQFKLEGEKTARKAAELLNSAKVKAQELAKLILRWLRFIPGVSQFYLEQEAKIKTDKLLRLRETQMKHETKEF